MAAEFSGSFLRAVYPSRVQVKFKEKQKTHFFIAILGLKYCGGFKQYHFKGRQEISRCQVVPFAISANFGGNLSAKVYAGENPYINGNFLIGF